MTKLLLRLALCLAFTTLSKGHAVLRRRQEERPREHKANHRKLQRAASVCADNPTSFTSSLYVNHVGDGTPFQEADLDMLLQFALLSYNQLATQTCDATFRTLAAVSVSSVFYTPKLDFIRLRYDFTGQCDGCVPGQLESGVGPIFGDFENRKTGRRTLEVASKRIKGISNRHSRNLQQSRKKNDICACPGGASESRGPTASEFAMALNNMIAAARSNGSLSGVAYVNDLFEAGVAGHSTVLPTGVARDITCANQQDFTTDVWVEFISGQQLTEAEKIPMEVALLETFNEMNLLACDVPFFRMVSDVSYVEARPNGADKIQMKFSVSGKCVNCDPATLNLFDTSPVESQDPAAGVNVTNYRPPSGSLLMAEVERVQVAESGPVIILRNIPVSCVCPLNQATLPLRSPTVREFAVILQQTIDTLRSENKIFSVQQVVRATEGEMDGSCSSQLTTFDSVFFADFNGRPELLQGSEVLTLEGGFAQTYNDLTYNSCDSYFRSISEVRLIPGISRRRYLQATGVGNAANSSDVPDLQSEAPSVYLVTGQCRGCPVTPGGSFPLTNDAFRFRKLTVGDKEETRACYSYTNAMNALPKDLQPREDESKVEIASRFLEAERRLEQCLCAPGTFPDDPTAPTPESFRLAYNVKITEYNTAGSVKNVQEVSKLVEVPPGLVTVGFSIFYGTLERVGSPAETDFVQLERETGKFFRERLLAHYDTFPNVILHGVTVTKDGDTTVRPDLDKLQVPFSAELIFDEASVVLPTPVDVNNVMARFDYVQYITNYLWSLNTPVAPGGRPNAFAQTHSVRFAGRESKLVDLRMLFTVRADRTNQVPNTEDRRGLQEQINQFFLDYLKNAGFYVASFKAHIDAEDVRITENSLVLVDFDATIEFSTVVDRPSLDVITTVLKGADLSILTAQLAAAPPAGTAVFNSPLGISFSD